MKAKIISKTYYMAETEDGRKYSVDINIPSVKKAFENNKEIEGEIHREEKQDRYTNGEYARSYTITEKFIPKKEKISLLDTSNVKSIDLNSINEELNKEEVKHERIKKKPVLQYIGLPKKIK
jgi:hypothetical protein